jgi:peptidoglycan/LPS O-acetylase OafA/YrhL
MKGRRIFGLDLLRTIAISIVVVSHSIYYLPKNLKDLSQNIFLDGVSIFFVLSGFLIGRILIQNLEADGAKFSTLFNFWIKRWFRTLPNYFLILSLLIFLYNYPDFKAPTLKRFYFFAQNIYTPQSTYFIESWSLSVEEWFYLLTPLLIVLVLNFSHLKIKQTIIYISVFLIFFSTLTRFVRYFQHIPINSEIFEFYFRMQVITRLDSLMYGIIGAIIYYYSYDKWVKHKIYLLWFGVFILIANKIYLSFDDKESYNLYNSVFSFNLNGIGTLLLIPFLNEYNPNKGKITQIITYISVISYSLYLVNYTLVQTFIMPRINSLIEFLGVKLDSNQILWLDYILFYILSILISHIIYNYYELPITKLRDNFTLKK